MIAVDRNDVGVLGHRPVRTKLALRAVVHGILAPKPLEPWPVRVRTEQFRVSNVKLVEGSRVSAFASRQRLLIEHAFLHDLYSHGNLASSMTKPLNDDLPEAVNQPPKV